MADENQHGYKTFQDFLDNEQYSRTKLMQYEIIYDKDFISTGGRETTEEFTAKLHLQPGQRVLDIGTGIGGSAFYMAEKYDVNVHGIDLSSNVINIATERANERKEYRVTFELCDATKKDFAAEMFDVVYSRDTILHIQDKVTLFKSFLKWLKPGGKLLISDYCCTDNTWSDIYTAYVKQRGYHLLSPQKYGKAIESAGFINVVAEDRTSQFVDLLKKELHRYAENKASLIQEFGEKDVCYIMDGWQDKLTRSEMGDQRWGLFTAEKPE